MGKSVFFHQKSELCLKSKLLRSLLELDREESFIQISNSTPFKAGDCIEVKADHSKVCIPLEGEIHNLFLSKTGEETVGKRLPHHEIHEPFLLSQGTDRKLKALSEGLMLFVDLNDWASQVEVDVNELKIYIETLLASESLLDLMVAQYSFGGSFSYRLEILKRIKPFHSQTEKKLWEATSIPKKTIYLIGGSLVGIESSLLLKKSSKRSLPKFEWLFFRELSEGSPLGFEVFCEKETYGFEISKESLLELGRIDKEQMELFKQAVLQHTPNEDIDEDEDIIESLTQLFPNIPDVKKKKFLFQYPFVPQNNQMDCGPACLAMVSKYFGRDVPLAHWREWTDTNRDGTSLFDLARTSEEKGFIAHSISVENISDIETPLLPCICLNKAHFVVVYAIKKDSVVFGDPSIGIREMPLSEFDNDFSGALLLLKPSESFFEHEVPQKKYMRYASFLNGLTKEIGLILVSSITLTFLSLFSPLLSQVIIDDVLSRKDGRLLGIALVLIVIVVLMQNFIQWVREYYVHFLSMRFDFNATVIFLRKTFSLPYSFFAKHHIGDFTRRLSELERLRAYFTDNILNIALELFTLFIYGGVLFLYSWKIGLLALLLAPLLMLISFVFSSRLSRLYGETFEGRAKQDGLFTDQIRGIKTLKALKYEVPSRWRFEEKLITTLKSRHKFLMTGASLRALAGSYNQILRFGIMGIAAYLAIDGQMTPGQVVAISLIASRFIDPFFSLANSWASLQEIKTVVARLNDVFLTTSEKVDEGYSKEVKPFEGRIEFQDVWFRYGGESSEWVLKGVSFVIDPQKFVTIVGASGSGKSTIAQLLLRLIEPTKGRILIDGVNYQEYSTAWIRSKLGIVQQESVLFEGTIAANIGYGDPYPSIAKIMKAAEVANAVEFIDTKPKRYDYHLSHQGLGLSDGEKQRISLARTLYVNSPILVLDEATSVLDGISEKKLLKNLKKAKLSRTIINISHRSSTLDISDYVILIDKGQVRDTGPHYRMMKSNQLYQGLFGTQLEGAGFDSHL